MSAFVALLAFAAMWTLWQHWLRDWRQAFLAGAVSWAAAAVSMVEILSIFNRIDRRDLLHVWMVLAGVSALAAGALCWRKKRLPFSVPTGRPLPESFLLLQVGMIAAVSALVAWIGPPNNWDSLTYHMPRVIRWIQDRNVAFFPPTNLRQLERGVGAEYLILQLQLLVGGDRLANLVQWFAYCGCTIGVSSVAALLGASARGQAYAAIVAATIPMACLEAVTTQNDLVLALWMICFIVFAGRLCGSRASATRTPALVYTVLCGLALGLAMLTKGTAYIFLFPFVLGLPIVRFRQARWTGLAWLGVTACLAVAVNVPAFSRNYRFSGNILGESGGDPGQPSLIANRHPGIAAAASNVLRNAGQELACPPAGLARAVEAGVRRLHVWLHLRMDDPDRSFLGYQIHLEFAGFNDEDSAPGPLHFILVLLSIVFALAAFRRRPWPALYAASLAAGYVAFAAYLRWSPWDTRLRVPLLIAGAALVGLCLDRAAPRLVAALAVCLLPLLAVPTIVFNSRHPLIGERSIFMLDRESRFFTVNSPAQQSYLDAVNFATSHKCRQVGLSLHKGECFEYILMDLLRQRNPHIRIVDYGDYPDIDFHTRNRGWDDSIRPSVVIDANPDACKVTAFTDASGVTHRY